MGQARIEKLLHGLPNDFEAALIQSTGNRFYLLDFDSHDAGTLLILPNACYFFVDSRYIESANRQVQTAQVVLQNKLYTQLGEVLKKADVKNVYIEQEQSLRQYEALKEQLPDFVWDAGKTLSEAVRHLRAVKDAEELRRIRSAQAITDDCFRHILPHIVQGAREVDLMLEMERYLRANGAEQVAFDTIFLSGANTSLPHGRPGETRLKNGDFITMDFGARYGGYCCDMTRTVALGTPCEEQQHIYKTVLQAQCAALDVLAGGLLCSEVDKVARDLIDKAGYGSNFGHGLGHAMGIEIHEEPRLSPLCKEKLLPGMVMSVEPGIYLPKKFGCRIEDTVVIQDEGCEVLAKSPKELLML